MPLLRRRADSSRGSTPTKDEACVAATGGEGPPYLPSTVTVPKRPRCRDYDEKGFCMRGDQCKFDHGSDAVVLEDSSTPYTPAFPPGVPQGRDRLSQNGSSYNRVRQQWPNSIEKNPTEKPTENPTEKPTEIPYTKKK